VNAWDDILLVMFPGSINHVPQDVAALNYIQILTGAEVNTEKLCPEVV